MSDETLTVRIDADTANFDRAMQAATHTSREFANAFSSSIRSSVSAGKNLEETVKSIGKRLADLALKSALKPIENLFSGFAGNLAGSAFSGLGGAPLSLPVKPFARGGVVSSPTRFSFGGQLGLMGEAGAEAIMPLKRGSDGRLGVAAAGASSGPAARVVFNVQSPNPDSFRRSEGQITAMLARAVARGQRGL